MMTIAGGGVSAMQVFRWRTHSNYLECERDARASLVFASVGKKKKISHGEQTSDGNQFSESAARPG